MCDRTSLSDQGVRSEGYAKQLKQLLDTTAKASAEIQKFLTDAKLASESLERVIRTVHFTQREQIQILKTIEGKSSAVYCEAKSIRKQQKAYTKQFQEATSTQIAQIRSIKQYMEQWVKTIVEHCKRIIAMVQRNTELLLSIHSLLAKLETLLGSRVDLPSIVFENVLGIRMLLPFQLCDTWEVSGAARCACEYPVFRTPSTENIHLSLGLQQTTWSHVLQQARIATRGSRKIPRDAKQDKQNHHAQGLVRLCRTGGPAIHVRSNGEIQCPHLPTVFRSPIDLGLGPEDWNNMVSPQNIQSHLFYAFSDTLHSPGCDLWLSIHRSRQAAGGVSMNDKNSPVPMPLPEKIQFRSHTSNETDWKSISVREHSLSPAHKARFRRRRIAQSSGAGPAVLTGRGSDPSTAAMDDVESFRRIHVQPYNGNFLRALFEVGENLRTLVIDMLAVDGDKNELIDEAPFADRYTDVITDFEVLRSTNISPLLEIRAKTKHMSDTKKLVMEKWVLRTAQLLFPPRRSFPIQPSTRRAIVAIEDWLQENSNCPLGYSSTVPPLSNNNPERSPEQLQMFNHYHGLINRRSHIQDSPIRAFHKIYDPGLFVSTNSWVNVNSECFDTDRKYLEDSDSDSDYDW